MKEKQTARFDAKVTGRPTPQCEWFRGDQPIHESEKYKIMVMGDGSHSLLIMQAEKSDAGPYSIKAQNIAGEYLSNAKLIVESKFLS